MNCTDSKVQEDLVAYLQDELAPSRATQVRAHLENCADCRRELKDFEGVFGAASSIERVEPSAEFRENLYTEVVVAAERTKQARQQTAQRIVAARPKRIAKHSQSPARVPVYYMASATAVVVVCLLGVFFYVGHNGTPSSLTASQDDWTVRRASPHVLASIGTEGLDVSEDRSTKMVYLLPRYDDKTNENFLLTLSEKEADSLRAKGEGKVLEASLQLAVENGLVRIPADFVKSHLGAETSRVTLVNVSGRLEIWPEKAWQ